MGCKLKNNGSFYFRILGSPIFFMIFSLSSTSKIAINKNGNPGTLYLTIAPITGVVSPIIKYKENRNTMQNSNALILITDCFIKINPKIIIIIITAFSMAAIRTTGDLVSKI